MQWLLGTDRHACHMASSITGLCFDSFFGNSESHLQQPLLFWIFLAYEKQCRLQELGYDEAAAGDLEAKVQQETAAAQLCRRQIDDLSTSLSGARQRVVDAAILAPEQCGSVLWKPETRLMLAEMKGTCWPQCRLVSLKLHSCMEVFYCADLNFQYRDPEPNFQRSRVKGVIARLIQVKDMATATALEVAAGGKMFQVVTDTEATGKALLSNGQLRKRVTIIPLNKVTFPGPANTSSKSATHLGRHGIR